jgi:hypothetical protein
VSSPAGGYSVSIGLILAASVSSAARTIESYPVHRHRFPTSPRRTVSASRGGPSRDSTELVEVITSYSETTNPGVQNPHCVPWHATIARWIGFSVPPGGVSPSTVTTCVASSWHMSWMHDVTAA